MKQQFKIFHHISQSFIDDMYQNHAPVFVLTTGRSGSKLVHVLFSECRDAESYHEALPTLQYFSNFAYHNQERHEVLEAMIQSARMEIILKAHNEGKVFVESNQCLTFFAHAIKRLYKNAKFIHLIRHPGDFITSAIRKGWHANDTIWESGRVRAVNKKDWDSLSHEEKLAWVWWKTNEFIEKFFSGLTNTDKMVIRFEDLIAKKEVLNTLFEFAGVHDIPGTDRLRGLQEKKINMLEIHPDEPENMKRDVDYPEYSKWTKELKQQIKPMLEPLSHHYKYGL